MRQSWMTTLDAFESHLDVQAELVREGRYDEVAAFVPPADLPAMPRVLVNRASELLGRAQGLTEWAGRLYDDASRRLAQSRRPAVEQRPVSLYVDQQA
jgi:hypothetical protein